MIYASIISLCLRGKELYYLIKAPKIVFKSSNQAFKHILGLFFAPLAINILR